MEPKGTFARLDLRFDEHIKYYEYGAAEMGLIACGITFANRQKTDGVLPKGWPFRRFPGPDTQALVDRLVNDRVWFRLPNGDFEIVGFLKHNKSKAEIDGYSATMREAGKRGGKKSAAMRAGPTPHTDPQPEAQAKASRKPKAKAQAKASRKPKAKAQATVEPRSRSRSDTDTDSQTEPQAEPPPLGGVQGETNGSAQLAPMRSLPASEVKLWGELWIERYEQAVAKTLGRPWSFERKQLSCLNDLVGAHCQDKTKIDLWIEAVAGAFVAAVRGDDPKYWSSYQAKGLLRWLNETGGSTKTSAPGASAYTREIVGGKEVVRG